MACEIVRAYIITLTKEAIILWDWYKSQYRTGYSRTGFSNGENRINARALFFP